MIQKRNLRAVSLFLTLVSLFSLFSIAASAETPSPAVSQNVDAACVINVEYRKVVVDKEMNKIIYPASTVKLMTALVAFSHFSERLDSYVTVTKSMLADVVGRNMGLKEGEQIRVTDLLHAMLVGGYNDAAVFLAHATSGSVAAFCEQMNALAASLGASETHYTNPTGLHDDTMVTTAYDTALIGLEIAQNDVLFAMTKTIKYAFPKTNKSEDRTIYNRNPLITTGTTDEYYYSYAEGMSAGATDEGGDCVVTVGRIESELGPDVEMLPDELSYVCVIMGGRSTSSNDDTNYACVAAKELLRYALVNFDLKQIYSAKQTVGEIPVRFSPTEEFVSVKPANHLYALLHNSIDLEKDIRVDIEILPTLLEAPIEQGYPVGTATVSLDGKLLGSTDLVTTDAIASHGFLIFMYRVKQITQHPVFIVFLLLAIGGIVYYLLRRFPIGKNKDTHKRNRYF